MRSLVLSIEMVMLAIVCALIYRAEEELNTIGTYLIGT